MRTVLRREGWRPAPASAVALALAAMLTGVPQALSPDEPQHRCRCPAGQHHCSCPRCAPRHQGRAEGRGRAAAPPCHGGATSAAADDPADRSDERQSPAQDPLAPTIGGACGGSDVARPVARGQPFLAEPAVPEPSFGVAAEFPRRLSAGAAAPAAPDVPPPRQPIA